MFGQGSYMMALNESQQINLLCRRLPDAVVQFGVAAPLAK